MRPKIQLILWTGDYDRNNTYLARPYFNDSDLVQLTPEAIGAPHHIGQQLEPDFNNPGAFRLTRIRETFIQSNIRQQLCVLYVDEDGRSLPGKLPEAWAGRIPENLYLRCHIPQRNVRATLRGYPNIPEFQELIPGVPLVDQDFRESQQMLLLINDWLNRIQIGRRDSDILREIREHTNEWGEDITLPFQAPFWTIKLVHDQQSTIWLRVEEALRREISAPGWSRGFAWLWNSSEFQERVLHEPTNIRRIFGWFGYFWHQLYWDLSEGIALNQCQNCGRFFRPTGRRDRRYCLRIENPECFRARGAERTRRARNTIESQTEPM